MKKILYIMLVALLSLTGTAWGQTNRTLGNIPTGWRVQAGSVDFTATETSHEVQIPAGVDVVLTPTNPSKVRNVTLVDAPTPTPSCRRITLDTVQHHFVAQDCDTLTGTLTANVKISIAAGATVTLDGVTINGTNNGSYKWAGISCEGNATLVLKDGTTNTVKGFYWDYPGIFVPVNNTLTIQGGASGTGKLIASSNDYGAGIGGGSDISCGNINIQGGDIKATGGKWAAGIGSGHNASCDTITISGGTVNATGGKSAAGIGSGNNASCDTITISGGNVTATGGKYAAGIGSGEGSSCGNITITSGVTSVTATKGADATNSIGAGNVGTCGTVTIGGIETGNITTSPYTYPAPAAKAAAEATAEDKGKLIGTDGNIYANVAAATAAGTTAVAKIVYVGSDNGEAAPYNHGLALAMSDANGGNYCEWKTSRTDAGHTKQSYTFTEESGLQYNAMHNSEIDNYPAFKAAIANNSTAAPTGCSAWFLASGYQWTKMFAGNAGGLQTLAGLESSTYWSSSESSGENAWTFLTLDDDGGWVPQYKYGNYGGYLVRSCLAF